MDYLLSLTINGLRDRHADFLLAAGLTLIFGLMDVLNFAHGGLFAWGAYSGVWIYIITGSFLIGIIGAIVTGLILGFITEKWIIKPVYGNHVQQILITLGLMLVFQEMIKGGLGTKSIATSPHLLSRKLEIGNVIIIKYRIVYYLIGFVLFLFRLCIKKTKLD